MKKKLVIITTVCTIWLSGCADFFVTTEISAETTTAIETTIKQEAEAKEETTTKVENDGLTKEKKMQVLAYINAILDPLSDTNMSDAELEAKADEVWKQAETKFGVSETDILNIMCDTDLVKEYYSNSNTSNVNTVTEYQATLEDNGYGTVVIAVSKEAMDEYTRALVSKEQITLDSLVQAGQIAYETNGTRVNIIDAGLATTKVKLLEGLNEGATVYVISEQVEMK